MGAGNVSNAINQDDLYVEMTFAEVMDCMGLDATTDQYGEAFTRRAGTTSGTPTPARGGCSRPRHQGPWSGHPKYNIHANDIDFQIEADFIGLMAPGLPKPAPITASASAR